MDNYAGYEWGWITNDGTRHGSGPTNVVKPDAISGVWCNVFRGGLNPEKPSAFYHEVFLSEYISEKGSWGVRPLTQLLKLAQSQAFIRAYSDLISTMEEDEIVALPEIISDPTLKMLQQWRCTGCGHEFYTPLEEKEAWVKRIKNKALGIIGRPIYADCQVCSSIKAIKTKVVSKEIQNEKI